MLFTKTIPAWSSRVCVRSPVAGLMLRMGMLLTPLGCWQKSKCRPSNCTASFRTRVYFTVVPFPEARAFSTAGVASHGERSMVFQVPLATGGFP
jgi:hypothetical protein